MEVSLKIKIFIFNKVLSHKLEIRTLAPLIYSPELFATKEEKGQNWNFKHFFINKTIILGEFLYTKHLIRKEGAKEA